MKTCFVVSPIGDKDSDVRTQADDLFDLIIEPALERFSFEIVRADKIIGTSEITGDIVNLIQTADLCIIDLTGGNPNVFYECGRRHEAGRPFVQLIRRGERIPFDLAGIRTIPYELEDARAVRNVSAEIKEYVEKFEREGYGADSGASIATVAQWIQRIDRKLDRVLSGSLGPPVVPQAGSLLGNDAISALLKSPREKFMEAIASSRVDMAAACLPALREREGFSGEFIAAAALVAAAGYEDGARELADFLLDDQHVKGRDAGDIDAALSGYVRFHSQNGTETNVLTEMVDRVVLLAQDEFYNDADRATFFNRLQMLYYGAKNYEEASRYALKARELNPNEPAYTYNLSLCYEKREMLVEAEKCVEELMENEKSRKNGSHISQAIDIYIARGRSDEARSLFQQLMEVEPSSARMKQMFDGELQKALAGESGSDVMVPEP